MKNNDERILNLKKEIEAKKKALAKVKRFAPETNCNLELDGVRYNLNTLNKDTLKLLFLKLSIYHEHTKGIDMFNDMKISNYKLDEWLHDIKSKLENIQLSEEKGKLNIMEIKLADLLSDDKKVELELDEIEKLIK